MPFTYATAALDSLDLTLTIPRLTKYLAESNGDRARAIRLYEYNTSVSQEIFGIVQPLEIAFRNAIHRVLTADIGRADWYDSGILQTPEMESISSARASLYYWQKTDTPDRVVAELTFGFWIRLLSKKYEKTLWVNRLDKCFPHGPKPDRDKMYTRLIKIRDLRNRVAHHEPIFFKNMQTEYTRILTTLEWICPISARWVSATHSFSRFR